jgi:SAM-dependent methyltransferase
MHPQDLPTPSEERDRYLLHHNEAGDEQYAEYIRNMIKPLIARVPAETVGLDYGCGPARIVETELERAGFHVNSFDPFFNNQIEYLEGQYAFIFCCETAEHFHNPHREFSQLQRLLKPGGLLQIVTNLYSASQQFDEWWYVRDLTHVCFYSEFTLQWIADQFHWHLETEGGNVAMFKKINLL